MTTPPRASPLWERCCGLALLLVPALASAADVLLFTRTEAFRHDSIPAGVAMMQALAATHGWQLTVSEDPGWFSAEALAPFEVVVWLNTTGDVLDQAQQDAFAAWVEAGGGWLGIHAAADCEYEWPWYGALLGNGAWFHSHPLPQTAEVRREAMGPSTAHLPDRFSFHDEWYNFRGSPRGAATVLLSLDESSYTPGPGAMQDHPIAWKRQLGAGRAWYSGFGHRTETYADPRFVTHVAGGMEWLLAGSEAVHADGFELAPAQQDG